MKKINFGFSNDINPKGQWEGIGIKPGLLLTEGEYYNGFKYEGDTYIVAKIGNDEYNRYPEFANKFIVRQAIVDLYPDGSGVIFLNQEQSLFAEKLENRLNELSKKGEIIKSSYIPKHNGFTSPDLSLIYLTARDNIITTSITNEAFNRKNEALKSCHSSFSELQEQINLKDSYTK